MAARADTRPRREIAQRIGAATPRPRGDCVRLRKRDVGVTVNATSQFRVSYASAFQRYLGDASETTLRAAYELGREAVGRELSVLDLAVVHHDVLLSALRGGAENVDRITQRASDFFVESLSAFEMVRRGFADARQAALLERQQSAMLRQLSNFLADASLALDASDSLDETLRLVAEQTRELIGADYCVVFVTMDAGREIFAAASLSDTAAASTSATGRGDLGAIFSRLGGAGGAARIAGDELATNAALRALAEHAGAGSVGRGRLGAPLTALDGAELGSIQLFDKHGGEFNDVDEALLVHLAQMVSAAIERAQVYLRES